MWKTVGIAPTGRDKSRRGRKVFQEHSGSCIATAVVRQFKQADLARHSAGQNLPQGFFPHVGSQQDAPFQMIRIKGNGSLVDVGCRLVMDRRRVAAEGWPDTPLLLVTRMAGHLCLGR
jgi:hypothetical protein